MSYASKVVAIAKKEVGYLEKKSNSNLDSKTGNAGYNNYCKYWRDLYPKYQGSAWCDCFVGWCFYKAFGKTNANKYMCGGLMSFYTPTSANLYKKAGRYDKKPKVGDQVFFWNAAKTEICHTGLVYKVTDSTVYTIEGNTSAAAGVVANGGGVAYKSYPRSYTRIAGYGHPKFPAEPVEKKAATATKKAISTVKGWTGVVNTKTNPLNVRDGAGSRYGIKKTLAKGEKVQIVEEKNGWGKLSTGGWVSLQYIKKA